MEVFTKPAQLFLQFWKQKISYCNRNSKEGNDLPACTILFLFGEKDWSRSSRNPKSFTGPFFRQRVVVTENGLKETAGLKFLWSNKNALWRKGINRNIEEPKEINRSLRSSSNIKTFSGHKRSQKVTKRLFKCGTHSADCRRFKFSAKLIRSKQSWDNSLLCSWLFIYVGCVNVVFCPREL